MPWLPAAKYLDPRAYVSAPYVELLCDEAGAHYHEQFCALCGERRLTVYWMMAVVLIVRRALARTSGRGTYH